MMKYQSLELPTFKKRTHLDKEDMMKGLVVMMSALMAVSAAPNWWSNGQTGGTFYPNNNNRNNVVYPSNNRNNYYPWNNGGTYVPSKEYDVKGSLIFEMKQFLPIIQGGNNNGYYNDKSGQCPYSNDRGYGGELEWGGYGPVSNSILVGICFGLP